jgi:ketosteroid isomerase-like protein
LTRTETIFKSEHAIVALERDRIDAMASNDHAAVEKFFAEDFEFFHGDGRYHRKSAFLDDMRNGNIVYRWIKMSDERVFAFGNVAVIFHTMHMKVLGFGQEVESRRAATSVWREQSGVWQIVVYKGVAIPLVGP